MSNFGAPPPSTQQAGANVGTAPGLQGSIGGSSSGGSNGGATESAGSNWGQWRQQLHNLVQSSYGGDALQWIDQRHGTQHAGTWESTVLVYGRECGRGTGLTRYDAREAAAFRALAILHHNRG